MWSVNSKEGFSSCKIWTNRKKLPVVSQQPLLNTASVFLPGCWGRGERSESTCPGCSYLLHRFIIVQLCGYRSVHNWDFVLPLTLCEHLWVTWVSVCQSSYAFSCSFEGIVPFFPCTNKNIWNFFLKPCWPILVVILTGLKDVSPACHTVVIEAGALTENKRQPYLLNLKQGRHVAYSGFIF